MDRCTGRGDITEILLKAALHTILSINQSNSNGLQTTYQCLIFSRIENIVGKAENAG